MGFNNWGSNPPLIYKMKEKRYIITKYVKAKSILDAIKKEKTAEIDEIYLDDKEKDHSDTIMGYNVKNE